MAKVIHKKCPSCKFEKCWVQARECENCRYDFKLQRRPRTAKPADLIADVDVDDFVPVVEEPKPVQTHKACPDCQTACWHTAPLCEKCGYNFKTGESQVRREPKKADPFARKDDGGKPVLPELTPTFTGSRPDFSKMKREPWMEDFAGPWGPDVMIPDTDKKSVLPYKYMPGGDMKALGTWVYHFMRGLRHVWPSETLDLACPYYYIEGGYCLNPHLNAAKYWVADLCKMPKVGVTRYRTNPRHPEAFDLYYLATGFPKMPSVRPSDLIVYKYTVPKQGPMVGDPPGPPRLYRDPFMTPDEAKAFMAAEAKAGRPMKWVDATPDGPAAVVYAGDVLAAPAKKRKGG